jgi:uncharacterized protein involved in outer membrane biogenesis
MMWNPIRQTRHRLIALLVAVLGLAVVALGSLSWAIPKERLEGRLKDALQRDTAYSLQSFGPASFSAFPWPTLHISDLTLTKNTPSTEQVSIGKIRIRINIASWFGSSWFGSNPRIVEMRIFNVKIHLGSTEKLEETEAVSTAFLNFMRNGNRPELRIFRVSEGQILQDGKPWIEKLFINVENIAASDLRLRANAYYQGLPLTLDARIAQGTSIEGRPISYEIAMPGLESRFEGRLFGSRSFDAEGISKTLISNGSGYARGFGLSSDIARLLNKLSIAGSTKISWPNVQMKQAQISFDQNTLDGSIEFSFEKTRPNVSATLGAQKLDLNSRLSAWSSSLPENSAPWSEEPIAPDWLNSVNADIRLSSEKVTLGTVTMDSVALASQLRDGRLDVNLSNAQYKSGVIRAKGQLRQLENILEARGSFTFDQIDLESIQSIFGIRRIKGNASGQISIEAKGITPRILMQDNTGKGSLTVRNGEFLGLDIERLIARMDKSNPPVISASGRTRFRSLTSEFNLSSGIVKLMQSQISTFGLTAPVEGTLDLNRQAFDLTIQLIPVFQIPRLGGAAIKITGPWSKPEFSAEFPAPSDKS